jgi:hypothetical protein
MMQAAKPLKDVEYAVYSGIIGHISYRMHSPKYIAR